jgi:hypothetical protein
MSQKCRAGQDHVSADYVQRFQQAAFHCAGHYTVYIQWF